MYVEEFYQNCMEKPDQEQDVFYYQYCRTCHWAMPASLLITMYVVDELSYDRYNEKADRIYRVNSDIRFGGSDLNLAVCSDPMGATLKKDYPQVEQYARDLQFQRIKIDQERK